MKVLITGGAGFYGMHLANYLQTKKISKVTLLDIHDIDKSEYTGDYTFIKGDIRDLETLNKAIKGHDIVVHAAAALPLWKAQDIIDTNEGGTKNVLEASLKNGVKRVVYISSTAVYGVPKVHPIYEDAPMVGVGPYGHSKIGAEGHCRDYIKKGLSVTIIRPKTFVGTGRLGVFEILFDWIHDGKKIPVIGDGNNKYELLDVDDLIEATYLFISKSGDKYNDAFNIGAERFSTVRNDLEALFTFAKSGSRLLPMPAAPIKLALYVFEKLGLSPLYQWVYDTADKDSFVSIDKVKKVLDWTPKYSNAEALIKAYRWYIEHYDEIKSRPAGVTHTVGWKQGILGVFKKFM